jgi:hypothetical protein
MLSSRAPCRRGLRRTLSPRPVERAARCRTPDRGIAQTKAGIKPRCSCRLRVSVLLDQRRRSKSTTDSGDASPSSTRANDAALKAGNELVADYRGRAQAFADKVERHLPAMLVRFKHEAAVRAMPRSASPCRMWTIT